MGKAGAKLWMEEGWWDGDGWGRVAHIVGLG